jgi:hypothetical protein
MPEGRSAQLNRALPPPSWRIDPGRCLRLSKKISPRLRHSWTIGVSRLPVSGNSDVIEYSARIHGKIEEDSVGAAFRPSVQENKSKNRPTAKL